MPTTVQTNFTAGEVSPRMAARMDLSRYFNACRQLENFISFPQGGVTRRPGTKYVGETKESQAAVLVGFVFSNQQSYMLEFGGGYLRFFTPYGFPVYKDNGDILELSTPYRSEEIEEIQWTQSGDIVYLVHPSHFPRMLTRNSMNDWELKVVPITDGPYLDENDDPAVQLVPSGKTGSIFLRARNISDSVTTGQGDAEESDPMDAFTAEALFVGVRMTIESDKELLSCTIYVVTKSKDSCNVTAKIYENDEGNPGELIVAAFDAVDVHREGAHTFTFPSLGKTVERDCWIVFTASRGAAEECTLATVEPSEQYDTGFGASLEEIGDLNEDDLKISIETCESTTSAGFFDPAMEGSLWRIRHNGSTVRWEEDDEDVESDEIEFYGTFYVDLTPHPEDGWVGKITLQKSYVKGIWEDVASFLYSTRQEFFETEVGVTYRLQCKKGDYTGGSCTLTMYQDDQWGVVRLTHVLSSDEAKAEVLIPLGRRNPSHRWCEGAWSNYRGFPGSIAFFEDRLWFGGSYDRPQTLWTSWTGDYHNFAPGKTDDAPLSYTLLSRSISPIKWLMPLKFLMAGTESIAWKIDSIGDKGITQTNINAEVQSNLGSASIAPNRIGSGLIFVHRAGLKVCELAYAIDADTFEASDLTLLAEHITAPGVRALSFQQEPYSILWALRTDGVLLGLTYLKREEAIGWHRHPMSGHVESIATIPHGSTDQLWMIVRRNVDGRDRRFIERLWDNTSADRIAEFYHLDCGKTVRGVRVSEVVASHLAGEEVVVFADGIQNRVKVPLSGRIPITPSSLIHVGLPFTSIISPMNIDIPGAAQSLQGKSKRLTKLTLRLFLSMAGKYGRNEKDLFPIPAVKPDDIWADTDWPYDVQLSFPGMFSLDSKLMVVCDDPCPMSILAMIPQFEVGK